MSTQYLKNIIRHLATFETKPKKIQGNLITDWFRIGEDIFQEFYRLGANISWDHSAIKKAPEVSEIVTGITKNQDWLQTFISIYPSLRIDLEGACSAGNICRVRSGIELLLRGFANINSNFDKVLKNLKESGDLDEFDENLKVWVERGHRPDFLPGDEDSRIPKSHWWWF